MLTLRDYTSHGGATRPQSRAGVDRSTEVHVAFTSQRPDRQSAAVVFFPADRSWCIHAALRLGRYAGNQKETHP
jgi:hypothetical protein